MRNNKIFLGSLILFLTLFTSPFVEAQNDAVVMLQGVADKMIAGLKANKATLKTKPSIVYGLAYRYVVPVVAVSQMSQHVLPPQIWKNATPANRAQFQHEFTSTLIRTYASALAAYEDQTVRFYPPRGGSVNTVVVRSVISGSSGQSINVSYRLLRVGGAWKLFDISVEGVSMLQSFRSQYADILSQGNITQLIQRMSSHNSRKG